MTVSEQQDHIKSEMLKFAPGLARDYEREVRRLFAKAQEELGPRLGNIRERRNVWNPTFLVLLEPSLDTVNPKTGKHTDMWNLYGKPLEFIYAISEEKLRKRAKDYGEETALLWYNKMIGKLGDLDEVTVSEPGVGGNITITGKHKEHKVVIDQHPIINVSPLGRPFHQFPSHIYVDGKFHSEMAYKKAIRQWGVRELERPDVKPKKPVINPNDRPREFRFEFKVELGVMTARPGDIETRQETAKGMSEEEAWKKIYRQEMRYGLYKRVFDQRVVRIWSWNNDLIWGDDSGEPMPKDGIIENLDLWIDKVRKRNYERAMYRKSKGYSTGTRAPAGMGRLR